MQLNIIVDPRDALSKARRDELWRFAKANNVAEINDPNMEAILMRDVLRRRGITNIRIPNRPLGTLSPNHRPQATKQPQNSIDTDATDDLWKQYQARKDSQQIPPSPPLKDMGINELRAECKRINIKLERRDNMQSLREKIEAARG